VNAVASLLDAEHTARVERLREELALRCGLAGVFPPVPHVSYHVAAAYDGALVATIDALARRTAAFCVRATGVAVFPGPEPVIYVPVVRGPTLDAVHRAVWAITGPGPGVTPYYAPERWLPHITLAKGALDARGLGDALALLNARGIDWEITVDNFVLVHEGIVNGGVTSTHPFGNGSASGARGR
jgi:2'-5' RNA ligase